jgi:quinol monooxygenase YgiN
MTTEQRIVIAGWVDVDPSVRDALVAEMAPLQQSTRDHEPGCIAYVMSADPVEPGRVAIYECWESAATLDAHFAHPNFFASRTVMRSYPRVGGSIAKYRVDATAAIAGPDGQATSRFDL